MLLNLKKIFVNVCLNNESIMSIINQQFFKNFLSNCQIRTTLTFVIIREINVV